MVGGGVVFVKINIIRDINRPVHSGIVPARIWNQMSMRSRRGGYLHVGHHLGLGDEDCMPLLISSIVFLVQSRTHTEHLLKSTHNPWPRLIRGLLHAGIARLARSSTSNHIRINIIHGGLLLDQMDILLV